MTLFKRLQNFCRERKGNIAITTVLALTAVMGTAAIAVDYSRIVSQESKMASALDSALLATAIELQGRDMSDDEVKQYLDDYFRTNAALMGLDLQMSLNAVNVDWRNQEVSARVDAELPMLMVGILGKDKANFSVEGSTIFGTNETEVAMTFDITGSMSGSKLASLKTAARNGIEELLSVNSATRKPVRISVIPYADAVNSGAIFGDDSGKKNSKLPDQCKTERPGKFLFTDDGPGKGPPFRDSRLAYCPSSVIQPLTSDEDALNSAVNGLEASGYTAGHIGIQWAWYMISPNWGPYLPNDSRPADYDDEVDKFAIIMTDGLFNTAFAGVPAKENPRSQSDKSRSYALKLCENMKASGIKVFTIGFALKDKNAIATMKNCASPTDDRYEYFYQASDGTQLNKVYNQIAARINTIRVTR